MLERLKKSIADDNELNSETLRLLSLIFLFISGAMSFLSYTHIGLLWDTSLTFKPGIISTLFAVFLISPLYLRGILKWSKSIYSIFSLLLILLVFASFAELALGGNGKSQFTFPLLVASIVISWLGIKAIAGISWILTLIAAIMALILNNIAMGFYGFVYIAAGFVGLILHSGVTPGEFLSGISSEYSGASRNAIEKAKSDFDSLNKII